MEITGEYKGGYTPEENIKCTIKINEYGIEFYPIDRSMYDKISTPREKLEYELKRFIGDKRFPYTWIIEYKDEDNKTQSVLTTINKKEYRQILKIKKELFYQENNKNRGYHIAVLSLIAVIVFGVIQIIPNNKISINNKKIINNAIDSSLFLQDSLLSDTTINF